jgi:hypothetical protein
MKKTNHCNRKKTFFLVGFLSISIFGIAQTQKGADIDGEAEYDYSGSSVSMPDNNTIAIGSDMNDGSATESGHVRVFSWNGTSWLQKGKDIDGEAAYDQSGFSICMPDSNTIAIGARMNNGKADNAGHVRIFVWEGSTWTQKGDDIDGKLAFEYSGSSISMPDNNTIAIGAAGNDENGTDAGIVRIYAWNGIAWLQKGAELKGEWAYDYSGCSVSMPDSNTLAVGADMNDGKAPSAGHVRIFSWDGKNWIQKGNDIDGEAADDHSGFSISMPNKNTIAIGAYLNSEKAKFAGHVRVYTWDGSRWVQKGEDIDGHGVVDWFGRSVCMPDENNIAIGAPTASYAGISYAYTWHNGSWIQKATPINGETQGNSSGCAVSMPDKNTIAIGANQNTGKEILSGHTRVYSLCDNIHDTISITACFSFVSPSKKYTWNTSGTYNDTILNTMACDSVITINLTINTADTSITKSNSILTANATSATFQWLDCRNNFRRIQGANSNSYTTTSNGNYAVEVTQNGCSDTSNCFTISKDILAFPNPTDGEINIILPSNYDIVSIVVRDALSQVALIKSYSNTYSIKFNIPSDAGVYTVEVITQNKKEILKILKI